MGLFLLAYALGAVALAVGGIALTKARSRQLTPAAFEALTGDRTPVKHVRAGIGLLGVLLVSGGLALMALSRWAAPIFILGSLLETAYLLYASRVLPPVEVAHARGRRRTVLAIYGHAAATALVLWLESQGVLG